MLGLARVFRQSANIALCFIQAIAALGRALQADPNNPEVLLSLGVSHTNELDQAQALTYLHTWMTTHKQHSQAAATVPAPGDSSQRLSYVIREFEAAAAKVSSGSPSLPIPHPFQVDEASFLCIQLLHGNHACTASPCMT